MFCQNCGTKKEDEAKFCASCGNEFDAPSASNKVTGKKEIKCGNCDYVGAGERARTKWIEILAWILVIFAPIITLLYFVFTHPYRCPKCKSTFVGVKNKNGVFENKNTSAGPLKIFILVLGGIVIIGIVSSVVLAALSTARQKVRVAKLVEEVRSGIVFPQQMGESVWLDDIKAGTSTINYYYSVTRKEEDFVPTSSQIKNYMLKGICEDKDIATIFGQNIGMHYFYKYQGSDSVVDALFTKEDCKN